MKSRQIDADAVYHVQKNFFFLNSRLLNEKLRKQEKKNPKNLHCSELSSIIHYTPSVMTNFNHVASIIWRMTL